MRGRVDQVKGQQLPAALQHKDFKGRVYRLAELVLDVTQSRAAFSCFSGR